jgi:hypothetical protein
MPRVERRRLFWPLVCWFCGLYLFLAGLTGEVPWLVTFLGVGLVWAGFSLRGGRR